MNQPYDPTNPYASSGGYGQPQPGQPKPGQPGPQGAPGQQWPAPPQVPHQPQGHFQQPGGYPPQGSYPQQQWAPQQQPPGFGPQPPQKSKVPLWIAAGLVLVLALGVVLFLVLRDSDNTANGGGGGGTGPDPMTATQVTTAFFAAVDAVDEAEMVKYGRGEMLDDIASIVEQNGTDEVVFSNASVVGDAQLTVDGVQIAVVLWDVDEVSADYGSSTLAVGLLDDGNGFQVCHIGTSFSGSASEQVQDWAQEYADYCEYTP